MAYSQIETHTKAHQLDPSKRASSIFPVYLGGKASTKILFLNYWALKNKLTTPLAIATLRNDEGNILGQKEIALDNTRAHCFDVKEEFEQKVGYSDKLFPYSIEIELFFDQAPLFLYPALFLCYADGKETAFVHSSMRFFNPQEPVYEDNIASPQTGFDVHLQGEYDTYITWYSSPGKHTQSRVLGVNFRDFRNTEKKVTVPFQARKDRQQHSINLSAFARSYFDKGTDHIYAVLDHDLEEVFPRFYISTLHKKASQHASHVPTLTHSFYDERRFTPDNSATTRYVSPTAKPHLSGGVFMAPLFNIPGLKSELISYGSNARYHGSIQVSYLTAEGRIFHEDVIDGAMTINDARRIDMMHEKVAENIEEGFERPGAYILNFSQDQPVPKRIKFGLNYAYQDYPGEGTNICLSPTLFSDAVLKNKKKTRRWGPIGGAENFLFILQDTGSWRNHMTSPPRETTCQLNIYNMAGDVLERRITLPSGGTVCLSAHDDMIQEFLKGAVGWVFAQADVPYLNPYSLTFGSRNIGGDHGF